MALTRINNNSLSNVTSAGLPSGSVIQVVTGTFGKVDLIDVNTYTDIASINITPTSTSSKIIVTFNFQCIWGMNVAGNNGVGFRILRDSTVVREPVANANGPYQFYWPETSMRELIDYNCVDEPLTTNQITYKLQGRVHALTSNTDYLVINEIGNTASETGQITVMEIAG